MHPPQQALDAFADGELEVTTRLLVEAHLALCPTCPGGVAERRASGKFPDASIHDELDIPPFHRLWERVETLSVMRRGPEVDGFPPSLLATLPDPSRWRWTTLWPNRVKVALLMRDPDTGTELYLCRFAPGGTFPRHRHVGREDNVILAGGYRNGQVDVDAGDWVVGLPDTEEMATARGDGECWCLSRLERPGVAFCGWRGSVVRWVSPPTVRPVDRPARRA